MGLNFKYVDGQIPLSEEEKEGLLIIHILLMKLLLDSNID